MNVTPTVCLVSPLREGGMGAVWLAEHTGLKTRVVVKFMHEGMSDSSRARTRFSREAAAAAQVKSPHVVQMLDHGVTDLGIPFIVMEYLEGRDLGTALRERGRLDPTTVVTIISQVGKALARVHAAGLLHRDVKPDNVFLCDGEEEIFVKLLDFGIVKQHASEPSEESLDSRTQTGQVVGTPFYMSPEQVTADKVTDERSDLWALGVVTYECLTGKRPFDGPTFGALAVKIATETPARPSSIVSSLPPAFDAWFEKACARDAARRFATVKDLVEALRAAFDGVVALPAMTVIDSGPRTPELALAPTVQRNAMASEASSGLARTEPGNAPAGSEPNARTKPSAEANGGKGLRVIGVLAVIALAGVAAVAGRQRTAQEVEKRPTPTPSVTHARKSTATKPSSAADALPSASASASIARTAPSASASSASPVAPAASSVTQVHGARVTTAKPPASVAPSAPPSASAKPSTTPANAHDDPLF
ncbi:serine-threonine protein kinase (pknH) [Labilithrix luteola]|uniref:Serine-threonine protein kinase (PknH) n=1 Tax=Labilithrix luteola TaxID=1391654 RepID=A0A0K1PX77_9BACT|nr:serine/threonine-protein kinase [Labilithrix luteola]AKU97991.1 serine-threonine protein kinase (pknH) [Labilithrix luteola]